MLVQSFIWRFNTRYRCPHFPKLCALLEKAMRKFSIESSLYLYSKFILRYHFESRVNRRELHWDLSPAESTLFRSCPNFHAIYQRFSATCYAFKMNALYSSRWLKGWSSGNFHQGSITFKICNYKVTLNTDLKDNRKIKGIYSRDQGLCFWWNIASGHFYDYIILRLPRKLDKKFPVWYFRMAWERNLI